MKILILNFITLFFLAGCQVKKDDKSSAVDSTSINVAQANTHDSKIRKSDRNQAVTFERINQILYDNLINGEFGPHPVKNDSGYFELETESYIERLRRNKIFSERFFDSERARVRQCELDLQTLKHTGDTGVGWAPNSCFFDFMYWLKSQENPDGYELQGLQTMDSIAKSTMVFFSQW